MRVEVTFFVFIFSYCNLFEAFGDNSQRGRSEIVRVKTALRDGEHWVLGNRLDIQFMFGGKQIDLHLKRNTELHEDAPLYKLEVINGRVSLVKALLDKQESYEYQDVERGGVFTVRCSYFHSSCVPVMVGSFYEAGTEYQMEPFKSSAKLKFRNIRLYRISEIDHNEQHFDDDEILNEDIEINAKRNNHDRRKRQTNQNYVVELAIVIDDSVFESWYDTSTFVNHEDKVRDATEKIREYFAHIVNGISLRYATIQHGGFSVSIVLHSYVISEIQSPWNSGQLFSFSPGQQSVNAYPLIYNFREDVKDLFNNTNPPDHIMLFTRNDLFTVKDGAIRSGTVGLAFMNSICSPYKVSIVETRNGYTTARLAAHELAHSLGVRHDGDGNICSSADQFIMATSSDFSRLNENTKLNPWIFSSCSVDAMGVFLTSPSSSCLLNAATHGNPPEWETYTGIQPGQKYSVEKQCEIMMGDTSSAFCWGNIRNNVSQICELFSCSSGGMCMQTNPARGTSCGNKKWCIEGVCVFDANAPALDEGCPFGDQKGIVFTNGNTCTDMIISAPSSCENPPLFNLCCASCRAYRDGTFSPPTTKASTTSLTTASSSTLPTTTTISTTTFKTTTSSTTTLTTTTVPTSTPIITTRTSTTKATTVPTTSTTVTQAGQSSTITTTEQPCVDSSSTCPLFVNSNARDSVCGGGLCCQSCKEFQYCSTIPCSNGATCIGIPFGFTCQCAIGYEGDTCSIDSCQAGDKEGFVFQNGQTCTDMIRDAPSECDNPSSFNSCCASCRAYRNGTYSTPLTKAATSTAGTTSTTISSTSPTTTTKFTTPTPTTSTKSTTAVKITTTTTPQTTTMSTNTPTTTLGNPSTTTTPITTRAPTTKATTMSRKTTMSTQGSQSTVTTTKGPCIDNSTACPWYMNTHSREAICAGTMCCKSCSEFPHCSLNPCFHGATCENIPFGFKCTCAPGYEGDTCNTEITNACPDGVSTLDTRSLCGVRTGIFRGTQYLTSGVIDTSQGQRSCTCSLRSFGLQYSVHSRSSTNSCNSSLQIQNPFSTSSRTYNCTSTAVPVSDRQGSLQINFQTQSLADKYCLKLESAFQFIVQCHHQ